MGHASHTTLPLGVIYHLYACTCDDHCLKPHLKFLSSPVMTTRNAIMQHKSIKQGDLGGYG